MRFILPVSVVALLFLAGCGTLEERRQRANDAINRATDTLSGSVEKAKKVGGEVKEGIEKAATTIGDTVNEVNDRIEKINEGAEKISDAIQGVNDAVDQAKEGMEDVKNAVEAH